MAGCVTVNVANLCMRANASSWARSQLRSRLLSSNDFNRRRGVAMSITVSISTVQIQTHTPDVYTFTQMRCRTVAVHRRWYRTLWASTTLAVELESPTDLFKASHWLERSSSRFPVNLLVFSLADYSTSQVLTTFYVVFISTFTEGFKRLQPRQTSRWWSTTVTSHTTVNSYACSIQISYQNIPICCQASMQAAVMQ